MGNQQPPETASPENHRKAGGFIVSGLSPLGAHETLDAMVGMVTDSAANLPTEVVSELGIEVVPMYLNLGDTVYRDGTDLAPGDFYRRLVEDNRPATTAAPSPGDFLEAFRRTGEREIVCVTIAHAMSASGQHARLAAERFEGEVEVVDSLNASMGEGFVAMEAARAAAAGASASEVAARAKEIGGRTRLIATVATFEFLRRSGRVTKLQAYAATALDIKPVFRFEGGEATALARPRTRSRALLRLVDQSLAEIGGKPVHVATVHAAARQEADDVGRRIEEKAEVVERYIVEVTPVIGAHTGPGMVGVAFFCD